MKCHKVARETGQPRVAMTMMMMTCRILGVRKAHRQQLLCPQSFDTIRLYSCPEVVQQQPWSCCRIQHHQSRCSRPNSCPSCSRIWPQEVALQQYLVAQTQLPLAKTDNPRYLCRVISITYLSIYLFRSRKPTVTSNDHELVIIRKLMHSHVRESRNDLLLGREICAFLEFKVTNRTRKCKISVDTTKVDESTSCSDARLFRYYMSVSRLSQSSLRDYAYPHFAACDRKIEALPFP